MSGTFYITGLQTCPCPEECQMWAKNKLVNINIVCLDKKYQVVEGEEENGDIRVKDTMGRIWFVKKENLK